MATVAALFLRYEDADQALKQLNEIGFGVNEISIAAPKEMVGRKLSNEHGTASETAKAGAIFGGLAGLLVGVGAIVIPGVGGLLTAGALATALGSTAVGAGIGAAAGGLRGSLREMGVPEAEATILEDGVKQGGILVTVIAEGEQRISQVKDVLRTFNAVDLEARRNLWERNKEAYYQEISSSRHNQSIDD
jgi:hypothetical protein